MPGTVQGPIRFVSAEPPAAPKTAGTAPNFDNPQTAADELAKRKGDPAAFADAAQKAHLEDPAKMKAVVDAAVEPRSLLGVTTSHDTSKAVDILNGAAQSSDPKIKANAFNESVRLAGTHGDTSALKEARKNLVASDTSGAIAASAKTMDEKGKAAFVDASFDALHDVANNGTMSEADKKANAQRILQGLGAVIPEGAPADPKKPDATTKDIAQRLDNLSPQEKALVYPQLAGTAGSPGAMSGAQLARLTEANPALADNVDNGHYTSDPSAFIKAIREGSDSTKVAYIKALKEGGGIQDPTSQFNSFGTDLFNNQHNALAEAAGQVLSSMKEPAFTEAAKSLTSTQIKSIMQNAMHAYRQDNSVTGFENHTDTREAVDLLRRAKDSKDPDVKAAFAVRGAQALSQTGTWDSHKELQDAVTDLLKSDINGIMGRMHVHDARMETLTGFLQAKIKAGETDDVAQMIASLQRGHNLTEDPKEFLKNKDNQRNLGYFAGALEVAFEHAKKDGDADAISGLFKRAAEYVPAPGKQILDRGAEAMDKTKRFIDSISHDDAKDARTKLTDLIFGVDATGRALDIRERDAFNGAVGVVAGYGR